MFLFLIDALCRSTLLFEIPIFWAMLRIERLASEAICSKTLRPRDLMFISLLPLIVWLLTNKLRKHIETQIDTEVQYYLKLYIKMIAPFAAMQLMHFNRTTNEPNRFQL